MNKKVIQTKKQKSNQYLTNKYMSRPRNKKYTKCEQIVKSKKVS